MNEAVAEKKDIESDNINKITENNILDIAGLSVNSDESEELDDIGHNLYRIELDAVRKNIEQLNDELVKSKIDNIATGIIGHLLKAFHILMFLLLIRMAN